MKHSGLLTQVQNGPLSPCFTVQTACLIIAAKDILPRCSYSINALKKPLCDESQSGHEWRRRESNPPTASRKCLTEGELANSPEPLSGYCQETSGTGWLDSTADDGGDARDDNETESLRRVAGAWSHLQPHIREAIITLIDAALVQQRLEGGQS